MKDQVPKAERITVAEAFRRLTELIEQHGDEGRFPDHLRLYSSVFMHEEGQEQQPLRAANISRIERKSGREMAIEGLGAEFLSFCVKAGVTPRHLHFPWGEHSYSSMDENFSYDISYDEFERWAAPYRQSTTPWKHNGQDTSNNKSAPSEPAPAPARTWQEIALEHASNAYALAKWPEAGAAGYELTKMQVGKRVAEILKSMGVKGIHGKELKPETIVRDALQKFGWEPPKAPSGNRETPP